MSKPNDKTAKVTVNEESATNTVTDKKVIHNVFVDTLEKPINTPLSRPSVDPSLSQRSDSNVQSNVQNSVQNTAGLDRRRFIKGFGTIGITAVGASSLGLTGCGSDDDSFNTEVGETASFDHGVASGDPLSDRVILWTRVTPQKIGSQQFTVKWFMARNQQMTDLVTQGEVTTSAVKDYTVKIDVDALEPNTVYYYQFAVGKKVSRVGKTKTLPVGQVNQVKMAVFSCANYPAGFFHVYADAAKRSDLDVLIHLGDYIYEYGRTTTDAQGNTVPAYASASAAIIDREVLPAQEAFTLSSYRTRYAQYKTDTDLQDLHAIAPMIAVWDDHELANDTYEDGADNHQPDKEGGWDARKLAAVTAYHEWMPIRTSEAQSKIYRSFEFGNLLSLNMLDTRVIGRDKQLNYVDYIKQDSIVGAYIDTTAFRAATNDTNRELLGLSQSNWLVSQMQQSTAKWQILGQQILMGRMDIPAPVILNLADPRLGLDINAYLALVQKAQTNPQGLTAKEAALIQQPAVPYNIDAWDGYGSARQRVLTAARSYNKNLVVLAGDSHNAWANNLTTDDGVAAGVEFATSSVSSPGFEEYIPNPPAQVKAVLTQLIGGLKYMNPNERGYMAITVTPESCQSEWIFVSDILKQTYSSSVGQTLKVVAGENKLSV
ncbi:alkaline phosphatase D family protein [Psychrobacter sp. DAB_AL43B]|uniref:alkaline phosphatase D family protein n=1 Tax=Psychrobacter sp. DAB_AL43B TaxID=1028416 RepID=UPI0009A71DD8|nr:alkaline phosphatase D family protein [Psychrobacter sp. DAB_AL43B]